MLKKFKNTIILLIALFTLLSGVSLAIIPMPLAPIKGAVTIPNYVSNAKGALLVGIWKSSALSASGFNSVVMRKFLIPLTQKASDVIVPLDFSGVRLSNGTYYITAAAYTDALKALSYIPPNLKVMNTSIFKYGEYSDGLWGKPSPITYSGDQLAGLDFTLNMSPALTTGITKPPIDTTITKPPIDTTITKPPIDTTITKPPIDTTVTKPPIDTTITKPPIDTTVTKPPIDTTTTMSPTEVTKPPVDTTMPPTTTTIRPTTSSNSNIAFNGTITFAAPGAPSVLYVGAWPVDVGYQHFYASDKPLFIMTYNIDANATSASYSFQLSSIDPRSHITRTYFNSNTNYHIAAFLLKGHDLMPAPLYSLFPIAMQAGDLCGEFRDGYRPGRNAEPIPFQGSQITCDFNLNYVIQSADLLY